MLLTTSDFLLTDGGSTTLLGTLPQSPSDAGVVPDATEATNAGYAGVDFTSDSNSLLVDAGLSVWQHRATSNSVTAQYSGAAMAYDPVRGRTVLFGGTNNSSGSGIVQNKTLEWDGFRWLDLTPSDPTSSNTPSARSGHAMVYDAARGKVMLFRRP